MKRTPKRSRRVEHKVKSREPAPEELLTAKIKAKTKPRHDWKAKGVMISDHAVVRFLEIVGGLNMQDIRELMVSEGRDVIIKRNSFCKIPIERGAKLVVRDGIVVTVLRRAGEYKKGAPK